METKPEVSTVILESNQKNFSPFPIATVRHSTAHLMAAAIARLYKGARFGVGPAIENGFYYDIGLPGGHTLREADLRLIEEEMVRLKGLKIPFQKSILEINAAIQLMEELNQPYKMDLLNLLKTKGSTAVSKEVDDECAIGASEDIKEVSLYTLGEFVDLCRGPHVDHSGQTGVFKLNNITSAYWRGNAENDSLQRIYGLCFNLEKDLKKEEKRLELIKEIDHRTLGARQKLFFFRPNEVGVGLPLWAPNGTAIRKELELLVTDFERMDGYFTVATPPIAREALYERSGHLPYYKDDMYSPIDIEGDKYRLRPMNCPHHHLEYLNEARSYRDLPLRFAEYGNVFRYEKSGALTGLLRTRGFTQNDAHLYCRYDQAKEVFIEVMNLHAKYYKLLGIEKFYMRLSLPDMGNLKKYVDDPEKWTEALKIVREAMKESGFPCKEVEGEAAFYGPKVDFQIFNAHGNEFSISTNQLDFLASERFDMTYHGADDKQHPVYVIHRAPLGSHERFIAFLTEHFKGMFPTWLAPVHVKIVPVAADHIEYANTVRNFLFNARVRTGTGGLRVQVDESSDTLNKKIRNAQQEKTPYIIVVGNREVNEGTLAVRLRNNKTIAMSTDNFLKRIKYEVENRLDLSSQEEYNHVKKHKQSFAEFLIDPKSPLGSSTAFKGEKEEKLEEVLTENLPGLK